MFFLYSRWQRLMERVYDWSMDISRTKYALWFLVSFSFIESSFFPIPPDVLLIPMVLANRKKAWFYATFCTISSVLGGYLGYFIGMFLYDLIAVPILNFYGYMSQFEEFKNYYNSLGAWIVFGAGVTPFPYKVITIASGITGLDLFTFTIASLLSRGLRFFVVAGLLWYFGAKIQSFIEKNLGWLSIVFFILLIGGFVALKYL